MTNTVVTHPQIAAKNPNKKIKFIIGGILIVIAIAYLVFSAVQNTGAYYIPLDEINKDPSAYVGKNIRVSGAILQESADWDAPNLMLNFRMSDESGESILVSFHGSRPSNFDEATEAIVEGHVQPDGTFKADNLLLKCPSRYEEAPQANQYQSVDTQ